MDIAETLKILANILYEGGEKPSSTELIASAVALVKKCHSLAAERDELSKICNEFREDRALLLKHYENYVCDCDG